MGVLDNVCHEVFALHQQQLPTKYFHAYACKLEYSPKRHYAYMLARKICFALFIRHLVLHYTIRLINKKSEFEILNIEFSHSYETRTFLQLLRILIF